MKTLDLILSRISAAMFAAASLATLIGIVTVVSGCPGPQPLRPPQCLDNPNLSNCGLCSSQPVCGWCASDDANERGCFDRRQATCEHGVIVRLPEACDGFTDVQQGLVSE